MGKVINALLGAQTILIWTNDFQFNNKIKQPRVISFVTFTVNSDLIVRIQEFSSGGGGVHRVSLTKKLWRLFLFFFLFADGVQHVPGGVQ